MLKRSTVALIFVHNDVKQTFLNGQLLEFIRKMIEKKKNTKKLKLYFQSCFSSKHKVALFFFVLPPTCTSYHVFSGIMYLDIFYLGENQNNPPSPRPALIFRKKARTSSQNILIKVLLFITKASTEFQVPNLPSCF